MVLCCEEIVLVLLLQSCDKYINMEVILTVFLALLILIETRGDNSVCSEEQLLSVVKAFQKLSSVTQIIYYDLPYNNSTSKDQTYSYFLGDIESPNERWQFLTELLDGVLEEERFIVVMGSAKVPNIHRSKRHYWLLQDSVSILESMSTLRLDSLVFLYHCSDNSITINELYAIKGIAVNNFVGTVHRDTLSYHCNSNIWQRRANLLGATITNTYLPYPTLNVPILNQKGETVGHTGYLADVLATLGTMLNFTIRWIQPPDKSWGKPIGNSSNYDGMLGQLMDGSADVSSSGMFISRERMEIIDFTVSIFEFVSTITTGYNSDMHGVNLKAFVAVFTNKVWISYTVLVCIVISVWAGSNFVQSGDSSYYSSAIATVGTMSMPRGAEIPEAYSSARILIIVTSTFGFLMYVHYSATLTSLMTTGPPPLSLKSFRDVLDMDMNIIVWQDSIPKEQMASAKEGTAQNEAYKKMLSNPERSFLTSQEAITNRLYSNPLTVYYGPTSAFIKDPKLKIFMIEERAESHAGFALPKDSELRLLFNYHLVKLREIGALDLLKLKHTTPSSEGRNLEVKLSLSHHLHIKYTSGLWLAGCYCSCKCSVLYVPVDVLVVGRYDC